MNNIPPYCYDSDDTGSDQPNELDHGSREDAPLFPGNAPSGAALEAPVEQ